MRRTFPRRSRTRATVAKQVSRALNKRERVQAEWMPLRTWHCESQMFVPDGQCAGVPAQLGLWDPEERQTTGPTAGVSQGAVIHRIQGHLYFLVRFQAGDPLVPLGTDLAGLVTLYGGMQTTLRVGLMKQRGQVAESGLESILQFNPLTGFYDPSGAFSAGDWTDGRWMRQWEHHWGPKYSLGYQFAPPSCCSSGGSPLNPLELGTGNINTAISCSPCSYDEETALYASSGPYGAGPFPTASVDFPQWWKLSIDVRTKLRMEETDRLDLWAGWYNGRAIGLDPVAQPRLHVKGDIRGLVSRP